MKKKRKNNTVKRILWISFSLLLVINILFYCFKKDILSCIIASLGTIISAAGFLVMIKMIDRYLTNSKGRWLFLAVGFAKMAVITGGFYLASRISKTAVIMYIVGFSVVIAAIMIEAVYQFYRSYSKNGRT